MSVLRMRALADVWEMGLEAVLVVVAAGLANVLYFAFSTPKWGGPISRASW